MNAFNGLDLLASAVFAVDSESRIQYANTGAENLLEISSKILIKQKLSSIFTNGEQLETLIQQGIANEFAEIRKDFSFVQPGREHILQVNCIISVIDEPNVALLIEFQENIQQIKFDREERIFDQGQANKELIRNLAHEIKNPLGGIRGAAQLLEMELPERQLKELREYTQVIIRESGRLQNLVDRLLEPHRVPHIVGDVNIHEVCENVRSVILAEFPAGLTIERDYDLSIPEFRGDKEQLIQATLNIAHNAAEALSEQISNNNAIITLQTRVARQVTIAKVRYKLALDLLISDNGPGIPCEISERIFAPLVTGKDGGSGLGLTLAQTFVHQHHGVIEFESQPGQTNFRIRIPLP